MKKKIALTVCAGIVLGLGAAANAATSHSGTYTGENGSVTYNGSTVHTPQSAFSHSSTATVTTNQGKAATFSGTTVATQQAGNQSVTHTRSMIPNAGTASRSTTTTLTSSAEGAKSIAHVGETNSRNDYYVNVPKVSHSGAFYVDSATGVKMHKGSLSNGNMFSGHDSATVVNGTEQMIHTNHFNGKTTAFHEGVTYVDTYNNTAYHSASGLAWTNDNIELYREEPATTVVHVNEDGSKNMAHTGSSSITDIETQNQMKHSGSSVVNTAKNQLLHTGDTTMLGTGAMSKHHEGSASVAADENVLHKGETQSVDAGEIINKHEATTAVNKKTGAMIHGGYSEWHKADGKSGHYSGETTVIPNKEDDSTMLLHSSAISLSEDETLITSYQGSTDITRNADGSVEITHQDNHQDNRK